MLRAKLTDVEIMKNWQFLIFFIGLLSSHCVWCYTSVTTPYLIAADDILVAPIEKNEWQKIASREVAMIELKSTRVKGRPTHYKIKIVFRDGRPSLVASINRHQFERKTTPFDPVRISEEVNVVLDSLARPNCPEPVVSESPPPSLSASPRIPLSQSINSAYYVDEPLSDPQDISDQTQYERIRTQTYRDARESGPKTCRANLRKWYRENSVWKDLSKYNRALNVLALANQNIGMLRQKNALSPGLTPSVLACIVRNESSSFYPESVNYTFCNPRRNKYGSPFSSAHGLGQCTSTRFRDLRRRGIINEPPYSNDKDVERHYFLEMNSRPGMQIKMMALDFNHMLKRKNLTSAVAEYDQDRHSSYLKKFRQCQQCFVRHRTSRAQIEECMLK